MGQSRRVQNLLSVSGEAPRPAPCPAVHPLAGQWFSVNAEDGGAGDLRPEAGFVLPAVPITPWSVTTEASPATRGSLETQGNRSSSGLGGPVTRRGHIPIGISRLLVFVLTGPSLLSLHPFLPLSILLPSLISRVSTGIPRLKFPNPRLQ